jgi:hypothetical protein
VEFSETDHPLVRYLMEWNNGSNVVAGIPHIGGPRNSSTYQHPDNTDFLGTITSGVHRGFDFLIEHHKDAESGLTILSPSHPEYGRRPSHTALMAAILRRAVEQAHVDPDIKATLTANQTVTMSGPAEKIGDGQYHRYRLEVPAGLGTLQIALAGLTGNVDLFVQRNGPAHAGSYLAKADATGNADDVLTIHNPAPGTYEISLFGAHATANGEAYTLSVKQEATYEWLAIDDPPMEGEHTTPHEEGDTMRTMRRRIEARVNATMAQAAGTMAHGNRAINKAEAALDELLELLERLETDGLAIELVIAGRPFPVALRLAPAPEAPAPQATPTQDPPP